MDKPEQSTKQPIKAKASGTAQQCFEESQEWCRRAAHAHAELDRVMAENVVMREALEHCLEASSDPPKYGRYLSNEDREIIRKALSTTCGQDFMEALKACAGALEFTKVEGFHNPYALNDGYWEDFIAWIARRDSALTKAKAVLR